MYPKHIDQLRRSGNEARALWIAITTLVIISAPLFGAVVLRLESEWNGIFSFVVILLSQGATSGLQACEAVCSAAVWQYERETRT